MTPLLLLDVDGVLNPLGHDEEHFGAWADWCAGNATADGVSWPILWAPAVVDQLRSWHIGGVVEIQWLTTWGHEANDELRELLQMPKLPVAGTYEEEGAAPNAWSEAAASHADVAPAAPDPLSGVWWKYDVVRRLVEQEADRLIIWVDDELQPEGSPFRRWAEAVPQLHPVGPDPMTGLRNEDLAAVSQLLSDS